jgi:serine/threonine protein kinase
MSAHSDPGPPEQRLTEVLAAYLEAIDAGWAPEEQAFLDHYPDLAPDLAAFFQNQHQVAHLAHSLPPPMQANGRGQDSSGSWNPAESPTLPQSDSSPSTDPHLDNVRYFDGYEILEEISRGGMGIVFKARQRGLSRLVALKMILAGQCASPIEIQRFLHESENASLLDHPNIVPIYTVGEYHGQRYFTMKLIEGGNLSKHLPRLAQDLKAGVRVLVTVAHAVHYAHQRGVLHRDLKPANILLDQNGEPHITDFGLAKRIPISANPDAVNTEAGYVAPEQIDQRDGRLTTVNEATQGQATTLSAVAGTPSYMPPEQAGPQRGALTTAADVYSLGAILYKLLTGQPPFRGATWQETLELVRDGEPALPRSVQPHLPRDLEAICLKCLHKEPELRYASAQALANDLENWLKGEPVEARRRSLPARVWHTLYRNALLCAATAALGFAAGAFLLYSYLMDPDRVLKAELRKLDRGETVTLIDETGGPAWSRWIQGEDTVRASPSRDQPFSFSTLERSQIQLLTRTPAGGYRISADVRHDDAFGISEVGIFFAHSVNGQESNWCELTFAEEGTIVLPPPDPQMPATSKAMLKLLHPSGALNGVTTFETHLVHAIPFVQKNNQWRHVIAEVQPTGIRTWWDNQPLSAMTDRDLANFRYPPLKPGVLASSFDFDPFGGLGLCVSRGTASFRNVQVEPIH